MKDILFNNIEILHNNFPKKQLHIGIDINTYKLYTLSVVYSPVVLGGNFQF